MAIAEAAERYAGGDLLGEERIWASAQDLDGDCLEFERYPRCSAREYANPACPVTPFDPTASIRWVRGLDLVSAEETWVPAVMACYGLTNVVAAEKFVYRISTGYAVHTDPVEAVVRGICEVVERDMIAILWLQRLSVPRVSPEDYSAATVELVEWCRSRFRQVHLFDATTDLGIPTAYCVLAADHDPKLCRVVGAGTAPNITRAAEKALYEALGTTEYLGADDKFATDFAKFDALSDGGRYMGVAERAGAFDFLLKEPSAAVARHRAGMPEDPDLALSHLTQTLAEAGMRPVAVDRTPRELTDAGLTAVSVVIPDLQPMSLHPLAQFKAHRRLYEAPRRMGYPARTEEELNPWPQPFG